MKPEMKKALREAMEAPPAIEKERFLKSFPSADVSQASFILSQAAYIRKRVWLMSVTVFGIGLMGTGLLGRDILWIISALMPFAALMAVTENARSMVFGMAELELTCRFSLKSVVLARAALVGGIHLVLLCVLAPVISSTGYAGIWRAGTYMLVPYLLTAWLGLFLTRRIRGREALYACLGAAVLVSGLNFVLKSSVVRLFEPSAFVWWLTALAVLLVFTAYEFYKTMGQTEELSWN